MKIQDKLKDKLKTKYLKIEDTKSLIIFLLCVGTIIAIPVYWFALVPPALEVQEIHQSSYTATGYIAPGGYIDMEVNLDKDSIQGLHNGQLDIIPQNEPVWHPTEMRVDEWPGSKYEIKCDSDDTVNKRMILTVGRIYIPNATALKGKTVPITIKYFANYPSQTGLTEVLGGTVTHFEVNSEVIEKNITVKLANQVITQKDMDAVVLNEPWKKITSLVIWIAALLILLLTFTKFRVIEDFKTNNINRFKKVVRKVKKEIKSIEERIYKELQ